MLPSWLRRRHTSFLARQQLIEVDVSASKTDDGASGRDCSTATNSNSLKSLQGYMQHLLHGLGAQDNSLDLWACLQLGVLGKPVVVSGVRDVPRLGDSFLLYEYNGFFQCGFVLPHYEEASFRTIADTYWIC